MKHAVLNPFHAGEQAAQQRAGVGDVSQWAGGFIRDHLPEQHREFHTSLPFVVLSGADAEGQVWTTLVDGEAGFIQSPDPKSLTLDAAVDATDPLAGRFVEGGDIGGLGIELATRRRNRFSGQIIPGSDGLAIDMRQTFGNCPQYIHARTWTRVPRVSEPVATTTDQLSTAQIDQIAQADTMFIGSGHHGRDGAASNGFDASHRGGPRGFVHVESPTRLHIPDYAGNNFFNTIGNLLSDPRVGLLFVDFETGGLLHITGRAEIEWAPRDAQDPDAWRVITVEIDKVVARAEAISLRWETLDDQVRKLRVDRKAAETESITSFYLAPVDDRPLDPFVPGQHLPISVQIPGQKSLTERSYSLSGSVFDGAKYRLTIKREDHGVMSRFLHDQLCEGDIIDAQPPAGDFVIPEGKGPLVLVSAGVGLTPMISILHALAGNERPVWYVHGARNKRSLALGQEVETLVTRHKNLRKRIFFSQPSAGEQAGKDFDQSGRITAEDLVSLGTEPGAQYMLCGPGPFVTELRAGLEEHGIPEGLIHVETFGPSSRS